MGIIDAFSKEDRTEITISQLISMITDNAKLSAESNIMLNGYKKHIDHETVLQLLDKEDKGDKQ